MHPSRVAASPPSRLPSSKKNERAWKVTNRPPSPPSLINASLLRRTPSSRSLEIEPSRKECGDSEREEGAGAEAARLPFDADEHGAAEKEWQSPIECRELPTEVVEGGISRVHEALRIGHLKGHSRRLAATRAGEGCRKIDRVGWTIKSVQGHRTAGEACVGEK